MDTYNEYMLLYKYYSIGRKAGAFDLRRVPFIQWNRACCFQISPVITISEGSVSQIINLLQQMALRLVLLIQVFLFFTI